MVKTGSAMGSTAAQTVREPVASSAGRFHHCPYIKKSVFSCLSSRPCKKSQQTQILMGTTEGQSRDYLLSQRQSCFLALDDEAYPNKRKYFQATGSRDDAAVAFQMTSMFRPGQTPRRCLLHEKSLLLPLIAKSVAVIGQVRRNTALFSLTDQLRLS